MTKGLFVGNVPWIKIVVGLGDSVQSPLAILDTGFSGDLQITPKIAKELNLQPSGYVNVQIANGETVSVPTAFAIASMEGTVKHIDTLISDSTPLVGINFLSKFAYKAIVDCKSKTVALNRVK
ncbi:hypothetical protein HY085_00160 [Candidatus Gottesmanbacteria bacterium]|nr:hypothetical protein [Candidatus Gottesmanbacteria bacterium]